MPSIGCRAGRSLHSQRRFEREFTKGRVVVTFVADSEQSRFLEDFKKLNFNADRAEIIKLLVQEPEGGGTNRVVLVEFGPQINSAMTQGASELYSANLRS